MVAEQKGAMSLLYRVNVRVSAHSVVSYGAQNVSFVKELVDPSHYLQTKLTGFLWLFHWHVCSGWHAK